MTTDITVVPVQADLIPVQQKAIGGGLEGAERTTQETLRWNPAVRSPDQMINPVKVTADARGRDMVQNDGYAMGAVSLHRDNIVGAQYRLNAQPNYRALGLDEQWAEDFQEIVEARFNLVADSLDNWLHASGRLNLTNMVRLGVASMVMTGEIFASAEWIKEARRPFSTAVELISPDRISNPDGNTDTKTMRRGIESNDRGRPIAYWVRKTYPTELWEMDSYTWSRIPAAKPWGRKQILHVYDPLLPAQSRGVADMVAALKNMRMTRKFQDITLQQAVVQATYAAAIESDLPSDQVLAMMGGDPNQTGAMGSAMFSWMEQYMGAIAKYVAGSKHINIDGAMMPHLFPGTKMNIKPVGEPGGVGTSFEESLLRGIAAPLGLSYEEFARDFTKTNYSSARASMLNTWRSMQTKKKNGADQLATFIYSLWLEEEWNAGRIPMPAGKTRAWFYEPLVKDALIQCSWIGASRGQIDELKETQAALLRIKSGLSTYEIEAAKLGMDWRDLFAQRAREEKLIKKYGLAFTTDAQQQGKNQAQQTLADDPASGTQNNDLEDDQA